MDFKQTDRQITRIITEFVAHYLSIDQQFPSARASEGIIGMKQTDLSYMLKDTPYNEVYEQCAKNGDFHICLLDGALIQFHYKFDPKSGEILKHRLNYLPHPELESFCENPEFEAELHGDLLFADIKKMSAVQFPIRFDFDISDAVYREKWHSKSHLTLGNVSNCRIPVSGPVFPYRFIDFILRCFYAKKYESDLKEFVCRMPSARTLSAPELGLMHLWFE